MDADHPQPAPGGELAFAPAEPLVDGVLFPNEREVARRGAAYRELAQAAIHELARLTRELRQTRETIATLRTELAARQTGRTA